MFIASVALFVTAKANAQMEFRYISAAAGFDLSLIIPENDLHPTPGWGGLMDLGFSLGDLGDLHLFPNIEFWASSNNNNSFDHLVFEMLINGDFRYYFPLPRRIKARPYVGNGFSFIINHDKYDYNYPRDDYRNTDFGVGFDFLGGLDFPLTEKAVGFAELKGKLDSFYNVFKFTFGMKFPL